MAGAVAMAWLGMYIHNRADLPGLSFWSPENARPGVVWLFLFGLWWAMPDRAAPDQREMAVCPHDACADTRGEFGGRATRRFFSGKLTEN